MGGRKVRAEFDKTKEYSVDVSMCTKEEKKEIQQAFFNVGIKWDYCGEIYKFLGANQYSNEGFFDGVGNVLLMSMSTDGCNMTAKEFLDLVYEPENKGHVHYESMVLYVEDAKTHTEPWKLWEIKGDDGVWKGCYTHPVWSNTTEYRRKPKTFIVNGVEIPDLRIKDFVEDNLSGDCIGYCVDPLDAELYRDHYLVMPETTNRFIWLGILYEPTEDGKQAAILHSKAWLGI